MEPKRKKMSLQKRHNLIGWAFLIPASLLIFVFCFYPMIQAILLSFHKGMGAAQSWTGISNYTRILKDKTFRQCLFNTVFYFVIQVPIMLLLALILAQLLNNRDLKFKGLFRTMIFLPCATSLVSYSMIFKSLFAGDGFVNVLLTHIGMQPVDWFQNAWAARFVIIIALVWRWTGYNMVFYLSGLQNIDSSIYEAARIDGAGEWTLFRKIVLPLLTPSIFYVLLTTMIGTMQAFDEPYFLTHGGPGDNTRTVAMFIYEKAFQSYDMGYASSVAALLFIAVFILTALQLYLQKKWVNYDYE